MENQEPSLTPEVNPEFKEVLEIPSPDTEPSTKPEQQEFDFVPKEETIKVGNTTVVFREPTEEQLPTKAVPSADTGFVGQDFFSEGQEWQATSIGQSTTGNELQVVKRMGGDGYRLRWRDNGVVKAEFAGWYTTYQKAEEAARLHLALLWDEARRVG